MVLAAKGSAAAAGGKILIAPKGETTHYDWCVALLLPIMFAVHLQGRYHPPLNPLNPHAAGV